MEIRVGEYVRTECGIAKIKEISTRNEEYELDKDIMYIHQENYLHTCTKSQILKHSFNIKELIEPRDILEYKIKDFNFNSRGTVYKKYDPKKGKYYKIVNGHRLEEIQIIGILAHEQYERNCYRLEDD